ncbi:MAG: hypothetical protein A3G32_00065 [Deltaproteobacteria bacterium RIFCSPLOWO2_12_FULL_40_28]|nr:MAG: hypothetical protein A3C45_02860 [Deltaproteobacteria bacterium RIFCSPHIGHO2_02_FULL_40_28]OGQ20309.1 MAG: hypothetical protein A3E27_09445 [Deltaproteobacteria bacterium RIFCSPHIGHO2_12_FULL_40_32]OGQ54909.1 MAG: hypothetical protein A3G32_00065 [Deltaproteobacteria bacterium RIFCSPLOWO2_12_FULL_40_28]
MTGEGFQDNMLPPLRIRGGSPTGARGSYLKKLHPNIFNFIFNFFLMELCQTPPRGFAANS